ncbi:MAG: hypothetical protein CMI66_13405 [Pedosphaera sp.]|nr:hypothetical protein [Pedosphaera sp.]HBP56194.1 hypothetical protein [Verrucomicrobiales bacterium]|tara:strand:- start:523 stop:756 length:234 start_codon:yes stop_codon:yes gene_type:complete
MIMNSIKSQKPNSRHYLLRIFVYLIAGIDILVADPINDNRLITKGAGFCLAHFEGTSFANAPVTFPTKENSARTITF